MSEAQLIGRGARYFPFVLPENSDRFRRKFDKDLENELRVIEELHYHSINDSRYIAEIRQALHEQGLMDKEDVTKEIKLKESFKQTSLYKYGLIYTNQQVQKNYKNVFSFSDLGVTKKNFVHTIATGKGGESAVLNGKQQVVIINDENRRDVALKDIDRNIIQTAIARNPFYTFASLKKYFPNLNSIDDFIVSDNYLGSLEITFSGDVYLLDEKRREKLDAVLGLLDEIETQIRENNKNKFEGSREFNQSFIHQVFKDKTLKFSQDNLQAQDDPQLDHFISSRDWLTFDKLFPTGEEKDFVYLLDREIESLKSQYDDIYLMRNEGHFSIYNFSDGQAFQPDFVLYMNKKNGESVTYQIFIEPKGAYLAEHDRWKEDFLKEIKQEYKSNLLTVEGGTKYRLIGIPFYTSEDENTFRDDLNSALAT
jgi:type III restriction enzyme